MSSIIEAHLALYKLNRSSLILLCNKRKGSQRTKGWDNDYNEPKL